MKKQYFLVTLAVLCSIMLLSLLPSISQAKEEISFKSKDGLRITADAYFEHNKNHPLIVLFHQAGWSRGEYLEIAPKLGKMGFNLLAVDLRSGNKVNGIINKTAKSARNAGKSVTYLDAKQDIESALINARKRVGKKTKVIAWGSSYSAALVLQIAGEKPELVDAVLSFSPGEYFKRSGKPAHWVQQWAQLINVPVFISSAKNEKKRWLPIYNAIKSPVKKSFVPVSQGHHGSRALWEKYADSGEYWKALRPFLALIRRGVSTQNN